MFRIRTDGMLTKLRVKRPQNRGSTPSGGRDFPLLCSVQTGFGAHVTFLPMGNGKSFPGYEVKHSLLSSSRPRHHHWQNSPW